MNKEQRYEELTYLYLIYEIACQMSVDEITKEHFEKIGRVILSENDVFQKKFRRRDLSKFIKELLYTLQLMCADTHDVESIRLDSKLRNTIAHQVVLALTRREFWWLGEVDHVRINRFRHVHKIKQREAEQFFTKLIAEVRSAGHVSGLL